MSNPPAPSGLRAGGKRVWTEVSNEYELRVDELDILEDVCREVDMIAALERELKKSGLMATGSMGQPVVNPLVAELRQHRATKKSLWSALKLPSSDGESEVSVNAQRQGGYSRWAAAYGKGA